MFTLRDFFCNRAEAVENLLRHDLGVYLCGFYISMAENLGDDFDGDTGTEGDGGGEGVAADVGGDGFLNATCEGKSL